jgi:hypothetical protein
MHERFFALAEVLTFCIACRTGRFLVPTLMQLALIGAFGAIVIKSSPLLLFAACLELTAIILLVLQSRRRPGSIQSSAFSLS